MTLLLRGPAGPGSTAAAALAPGDHAEGTKPKRAKSAGAVDAEGKPKPKRAPRKTKKMAETPPALPDGTRRCERGRRVKAI